jgi:rare lipoprotein A (peptidoglycan hydrolase)
MLVRAKRASVAVLACGVIIGGAALAPQVKANPLVKPPSNDVIETGQASWYGKGHNGRRTSSGETFNDRELTAAHPSLPLGSLVKVTSSTTGRSVVVTINDRQPYHGRRVIDLSRAAAAQIGMLGAGTANVTLSHALPTDVAEQEAQEAPVEVAEAPDDGSVSGGMPGDVVAPMAQQRGRRHTPHVVRAASVVRGCCHALSAARVRHSAQPRAAQRKL